MMQEADQAAERKRAKKKQAMAEAARQRRIKRLATLPSVSTAPK